MFKKILSFFTFLFIISAIAAPVYAEPLYMWEDKNKVVHVSDVRPNRNDYITIYNPYDRVGKDTNTKTTSEKTVQAKQPKSHITLNLKDIIKTNCYEKWPNNYRMQKYCTDREIAALKKLKNGCPSDIPGSVFNKIRNNCVREWPDNYRMRVYCEKQELKAWRQLNR